MGTKLSTRALLWHAVCGAFHRSPCVCSTASLRARQQARAHQLENHVPGCGKAQCMIVDT